MNLQESPPNLWSYRYHHHHHHLFYAGYVYSYSWDKLFPREHGVEAILLFLFMVLISLLIIIIIRTITISRIIFTTKRNTAYLFIYLFFNDALSSCLQRRMIGLIIV